MNLLIQFQKAFPNGKGLQDRKVIQDQKAF